MLKKITLFALCAAIVAVTSCKDDDGPGAEPPLTVNKLTKAYGVVNPSEQTTNSKTVQLVITNVQSNFTEDFMGEGQYISLLLTSSEVSVVDGNIRISPGTYSLPAVGGSPLVIQKAAGSYFGAVDKADKKESQAISAGSITVSETSEGGYAIAGTVAGANNSTFGFEFSGVIYQSAGTGEKIMTGVEVRYNNKFIKDEKFVYTISLANDSGSQISFEICTPMSDFFKDIPAQTYTFSATQTTAGTILNSENSFYQISSGGKKYPIEQGEVTLAKVGSDYTITGTVATKNNPGLEFSFTGALPVSKASLYFKDGELMVDGQSYGYNYCDYVFFTHPNDLEGVGERMLAYMTGPVDLYYQYLPMAKGTYNVFGGEFPLRSFIISSNLEWSDTGFKFYDSEANETFYGLTGGSLELTSSSMTGTKYSFALSGQLTSATEDGEELTVDLTWDGTLDSKIDYAGYWYGYLTHPWTTLKADLSKNNFTSAVYNSYSLGHWYEETGISDRGYVEICCMTEGGEYEEWHWDPEEANPDNYYLLIGLNLAGELPSDGIPVGTYTMDKNWTFAAGTFMPGSSYSWNNNYVGCHIVNGTSSVMAPFGCGPNDNGGEIKISKSGANYTITVSCFDDGGRDKAHRVVASYTGTITDVDAMGAPALRASKKSVSPEKLFKNGALKGVKEHPVKW